MKKHLLTIILLPAFAIGLSSCQDSPGAKRGAVAGGLLGAGTGAIIGHQSGRPLEGAGIGAVVGGLGGALLGGANDDERREYRREREYDDRAPRRGGYGADPEAEYEEGYRAGRRGAPYGY